MGHVNNVRFAHNIYFKERILLWEQNIARRSTFPREENRVLFWIHIGSYNYTLLPSVRYHPGVSIQFGSSVGRTWQDESTFAHSKLHHATCPYRVPKSVNPRCIWSMTVLKQLKIWNAATTILSWLPSLWIITKLQLSSSIYLFALRYIMWNAKHLLVAKISL